jgi:2-polyprenyl-3-methyl-5-hydroxy-6-metoxy-1,4-benzoquinol methylase
MRDPDGKLEFRRDHVARILSPGAPAVAFLRANAARSLVASGKLIPYEFSASGEIVSPLYPFVSYPFEWADAQLAIAARFTIDVAREILAADHELKDASAWNIIFHGTRPVFCDHLSFRPIAQREWWAFGQFARHFILPLGVAKLTGLNAFRSFQLNRDGLDPRTARSLMGVKRFLSRYWPLVLEMRVAPTSRSTRTRDSAGFREHIYRYCELNVPRHTRASRSHWTTYASKRQHYTPSASRHKLETVHRWLEALRPSWVTDLGCNTGEYATLAAECGAQVVVAIDSDHDSVQQLFEAHRGGVIHPVVANLADTPGGRGWMGEETRALVERLAQRADVVICLALVHHLAISESIPLREIARLLSRLSRAHALVEIIDPTDPMVMALATQRQRDPAEFSIARQRDALDEYFATEAEESVPGTGRSILMLRRRDGRQMSGQ